MCSYLIGILNGDFTYWLIEAVKIKNFVSFSKKIEKLHLSVLKLI